MNVDNLYRVERLPSHSGSYSERNKNTLKNIPLIEKFYSITETGKIWSYPKKFRPWGKFINSHFNKDGYEKLRLFYDNKGKNFFVHRLVAITYIPNPNNYREVNHKNGIKTDNRVENLEWCTKGHNQLHKYRTLGYKHTSCKPVQQITMPGVIKQVFESVESASKITGLLSSSICLCANGKRNTCGGFKWKYL